MRIVNKLEFYGLPAGTLYSKYEPCLFTGLFIKDDNCYNGKEPIDFFFQDLIGNIKCSGSSEWADILHRPDLNTTGFKLDFESGERDGCFDESELFAIYDVSEVQELVNTLVKYCITPFKK